MEPDPSTWEVDPSAKVTGELYREEEMEENKLELPVIWSVASKLGYKYFVTFVDDFSRMTWLYLMKSRSEMFDVFRGFCAEIKTQFGVHVKILRSDNAKEYFSYPFSSYMHGMGMLHQSSCVDTPSQNGVAERKNRHLLETARALLFQREVPKQF